MSGILSRCYQHNRVNSAKTLWERLKGKRAVDARGVETGQCYVVNTRARSWSRDRDTRNMEGGVEYERHGIDEG